MTAEIAILNRSAVALAADSAITVGRDRVWKNANKLFHLSDYTSIGIMIYGNGDYQGIAWEIIIKEFRRSIGNATFSTVAEAVKEFRNFLDGFEPPGKQYGDLALHFLIMDCVEDALDSVDSDEPSRIIRRDQFRAACSALFAEELDGANWAKGIRRDTFIKRYTNDIKDLANDMIDGSFAVTRAGWTQLYSLIYKRWTSKSETVLSSGVVFVGYGEDEILPSLTDIVVDGRYGGRARCWIRKTRDLNDESSSSAYIIPFAQADIIHLFVEGLLPDVGVFIEQALERILREKSDEVVRTYVPSNQEIVERSIQDRENAALIAAFHDEFAKFRQEITVRPMLGVINTLPKEEMAAMAEALVDITSLKRKVESPVETVGGPVDVAVISRGDGFVWIKRKHYFSPDLNQNFGYQRNKRFG